MKQFSTNDLQQLPSRFRAQLINSIEGIKPAFLIGTANAEGATNLAIFNSVHHIGANPPLIGFILRPLTVERHTYDNLKETGEFTLNSIHTEFVKQAHQTSAKYPEGISEFDETGFTPEYYSDIQAPFVKESGVQLGCRYKNEYLIEENGCVHVIGEIIHVGVDERFLSDDGWFNLSDAGTAGIIGLDGYVKTTLIDRFSYAKPNTKSESLL
jgi:flavin reductase (DIM6/NTAB) family NADH-FMN oxidoreductase RutF